MKATWEVNLYISDRIHVVDTSLKVLIILVMSLATFPIISMTRIQNWWIFLCHILYNSWKKSWLLLPNILLAYKWKSVYFYSSTYFRFMQGWRLLTDKNECQCVFYGKHFIFMFSNFIVYSWMWNYA